MSKQTNKTKGAYGHSKTSEAGIRTALRNAARQARIRFIWMRENAGPTSA